MSLGHEPQSDHYTITLLIKNHQTKAKQANKQTISHTHTHTHTGHTLPRKSGQEMISINTLHMRTTCDVMLI